jgi:hypothetical protein
MLQGVEGGNIAHLSVANERLEDASSEIALLDGSRLLRGKNKA